MSTTTIVLGRKDTLKPIIFECSVHILSNGQISTTQAASKPGEYKFIELIYKDTYSHRDVMFAYDDPDRRNGIIYLGEWNDGVI